MSKSLVYKFESILGHYTRERKRDKRGGNVKKGQNRKKREKGGKKYQKDDLFSKSDKIFGKL